MRDNYIELMHKQGHKGHSNIMWFLQKKEKGSLGASPDGLIKDPSRKDPHGTFEAKYIILKDGESLKDALSVFFSLQRDSSFTFVQGKTDGTDLVLHVDQSIRLCYKPLVRGVLNNRTCFLHQQRSHLLFSLFSFKFPTSFFVVCPMETHEMIQIM